MHNKLGGVEKLKDLVVGATWYGRIGTDYEGIEATIDRITTHRVQVTFNKMVHIEGNPISGRVFEKGNFLRLFRRQKYEQMSLFDQS